MNLALAIWIMVGAFVGGGPIAKYNSKEECEEAARISGFTRNVYCVPAPAYLNLINDMD